MFAASADDVNADELLPFDDELGGGEFLLGERRERGRREAAGGALAVERRDEGGREARQFARADDRAGRDAEELHIEPVVLLDLVDGGDELAQIGRDEGL